MNGKKGTTNIIFILPGSGYFQIARQILQFSMVAQDKMRDMALSMAGTHEQPHFENTSFRVGKKIFATLNPTANRACVKLNAVDQQVFSLYDKAAIYPVPNKWGNHGWTNIELSLVKEEALADALACAYAEVKGAGSKKIT